MDMVVVRDSTGQRIRVADSWTSCPTGVFQRIITDWEPDIEIKLRSVTKLFSIMLDRPMDFINDSRDADLEEALLHCTQFVYTEPMDFAKLPLPKNLSINGKAILIPKDLGRMTIGQNIHVRQAMASKDGNALISLVTAIYLQPIYDNAKFDYYRALELEKHILKLPIVATYPIGFFFLTQLKNSGPWSLKNLPRMIRKKIQDVRLSLVWLKFLSSTSTPTYRYLNSSQSNSGWTLTLSGLKNLMTSWCGYIGGKIWENIPNVTALLKNL